MRLVLSLAILVAAGSTLSAQQMPEDLAKAKMMAEQRTTDCWRNGGSRSSAR